MQRRNRREDRGVVLDDEPMAMLDLSAYDVPAERRGAFRAAVAAGDDGDAGGAERSWTKTADELSG